MEWKSFRKSHIVYPATLIETYILKPERQKFFQVFILNGYFVLGLCWFKIKNIAGGSVFLEGVLLKNSNKNIGVVSIEGLVSILPLNRVTIFKYDYP